MARVVPRVVADLEAQLFDLFLVEGASLRRRSRRLLVPGEDGHGRVVSDGWERPGQLIEILDREGVRLEEPGEVRAPGDHMALGQLPATGYPILLDTSRQPSQ